MTQLELPHSPACERNKKVIADVLESLLPEDGEILEIGSGTGQHIVYFAKRFPRFTWQASDCPEYLPGLENRINIEAPESVKKPILLDVQAHWPMQNYDVIYSANTAHIMSWPMVCAMFEGVSAHLKQGGLFCLYGPFNENGQFTATSNARFDAQLKHQNASMGLRDLEALETLACANQLKLKKRFQMPANNQILVFTTVND